MDVSNLSSEVSPAVGKEKERWFSDGSQSLLEFFKDCDRTYVCNFVILMVPLPLVGPQSWS